MPDPLEITDTAVVFTEIPFYLLAESKFKLHPACRFFLVNPLAGKGPTFLCLDYAGLHYHIGISPASNTTHDDLARDVIHHSDQLLDGIIKQFLMMPEKQRNEMIVAGEASSTLH